MATLASPEDTHEGALTRARRERRQRCQRFDRIVVMGRKRPCRGKRKTPPRKYAPMTIRRSGPGVVKRRVPWVSGLSPKAPSARTRRKSRQLTRNTRGAGTRNGSLGGRHRSNASRIVPFRQVARRVGAARASLKEVGISPDARANGETAKRCAGLTHYRLR